MRKWRNLHIGFKLAISYFILILVFFVVGTYTMGGLYRYKKQLSVNTRAYLPLVENTNDIERLTNQVLHYLWEFTVQGDREYYNLGKSTLTQLDTSLEETKRIISVSSELNELNAGLIRMTSWAKTLDQIIDETLEVHNQLKKNQSSLNEISNDLAVEVKNVLYDGEYRLREELKKDLIPSGSLYNRHRKNRIINLIVDKGNTNMIRALEAIAVENPQSINKAMKEFNYINNLINLLDSLSVEQYELKSVARIRAYFEHFKDELYSLKQNLAWSKTLSVRREEIASVVIFEAKNMGLSGINYAGATLQKNYQVFNRSVPVYFSGLLLALIMGVVFSVLITRSITIPLEKSARFAGEIASGNLDATVDISQNDEVGVLAESLKYMGGRLKSNMEDLKEVERKMLSISFETEDKERARMAEDLHDSLGPHLSTIKLYINALKHSGLTQEKKDHLINSAEVVISEAISQAKNIAYNLLPNLLSDFGLDMAIRSFCDKVNEVSPITINFSCENYPSNLNRHVENMLFRIVKELINNTIKHAQAQSIDINMYFENERLIIEYRDDGKGFNPNGSLKADQRGLANIHSRVGYVLGKIDFFSAPGRGMEAKIAVEKENLS